MDYYKPTGKALEQLTLIKNISPLSYDEAFRSWAETYGYIKAYCFGNDFFDDEQAPYHVLNVSDIND